MAEASKVTFEVPSELKARMESHAEVNWSGVLREAVRRHIEALEMARRILDEQSDPRIQAVAERLKRGAAERGRAERHARGG